MEHPADGNLTRPRILAVSGSLRANSSNSRLLSLAAAVSSEAMTFEFFRGIADLPHFNPDIDREEDVQPPAVAAWRAAIREADGVIISCPEYAHGLPGSFKNALDWLVSSGEFMEKPTLLLNASHAGGQFAQWALAETLRMIGAIVLEESRLEPFLPAGFWGGEGDAPALEALGKSLRALGDAIATRNGPGLAGVNVPEG